MPPHGHGGHGGGHHGGGFRRGGWGPGWGWDPYPVELVEVEVPPPVVIDCSQWGPAAYRAARAAYNAGLITGGPCLDSRWDPTRARSRPAAMGASIWTGAASWTDIFGSGLEPFFNANCADDAQQRMADFDGKVTTLISTYWPLQMFTYAQIDKIAGQLLAMSKVATDAMQAANLQYNTDKLTQATSTIYSTIGAQANIYRLNGGPVAGLDIKNWVVASLFAISNGMKAMIESYCQRPIVFKIAQAFDAIDDILIAIWNALAELGKGIAKIFSYWTYVKWGAAAFIAYTLYNELDKAVKKRRAR